MSFKQTDNSNLFLVSSFNQITNSSTSYGHRLVNGLETFLQNNSKLKLTFCETILVSSNIALAMILKVYWYYF
mgnify:CR=1 FL=1